jgi:DNA-directed RNA polymerase subunit RPC12/RpoP
MVKCPRCGAEVEYFLRRKSHDPYLMCPVCNQLFTKKELPPDAKYEVRYMETAKEEDVAEMEEEELQPQQTQAKPRPKSVTLFEEPKEPTEIIAEILLDWGCDEGFVKKITEYINTKGYFDAGWLMNMLLHAKTGRRFTEQEAFMVVDMIVSALEREKQKMEAAGKVFPFAIMSLKPGTGQYPSGMYTQTVTLHPQSPVYPYPPQQQMPLPHYQQYQQIPPQAGYQQPALRLEDVAKLIEEKIRDALQEKKTTDTLEELKKSIVEYEKKLIELRHEQEKKTEDVKKELLNTLQQSIKELADSLKTSLMPVQPTKSEEEVTKKDLELMLEKLKREEMEKRHELERQLLETKFSTLMEKIETTKSAPVSPEGWQKDETRLVAELGSRFFDIIKERKPIEYLVRILPVQPQQQQQPQQPQKTEKTLVDLIKESGGEVE